MRADQIMTQRVITIDPEASIIEAAALMVQHRIGGLPVVNKSGELIGLISESDFLRRVELGTQRKRGRWLELLVGSGRAAAEFVRQEGRKVGEVMTANPRSIIEATSLEEIAKIMEANHIKRLPVLRGTRVVGIVTRFNLVQAVAHFVRDNPVRSVEDDQIRTAIVAVIEKAKWSPSRLNVSVHDGIATLHGLVKNPHCRRAAIVAAENVAGVRLVQDGLDTFPDPEEDLGGGDFVSLQSEPATADDMPL
jgi:CBS domain-containing protein